MQLIIVQEVVLPAFGIIILFLQNMTREDCRRVQFGATRGVPESEAVAIFRAISREELIAAINPYFASERRVSDAVSSKKGSDKMKLVSHLATQNPPAYLLGRVIDRCFPRFDLREKLKEPFGRIMNVPRDDAAEASKNVFELNFVHRAMLLGLSSSFTKPHERPFIFSEEALLLAGLQLYQAEQIVKDAPDLSVLADPASIVSSVAAFLSEPEVAVETVCLKQVKEHPEFVEFGRMVGAQYRNSLYGVMIGMASEVSVNIFRPEPNPNGYAQTETRFLPQTSLRGMCHGMSLVQNTLAATGVVLAQNHEMIAGLIGQQFSSSS